MATCNNLGKYTGEVRENTFSFSCFDEIINGDTIASLVSIAAVPTGLVFAPTSTTATEVLALVSGGTAGVNYVVTVYALTTDGFTLGGRVTLSVQ